MSGTARRKLRIEPGLNDDKPSSLVLFDHRDSKQVEAHLLDKRQWKWLQINALIAYGLETVEELIPCLMVRCFNMAALNSRILYDCFYLCSLHR